MVINMNKKRSIGLALLVILLAGTAMAEPILHVKVSLDEDELFIENTRVSDGYPPTNPSDSGPYMMRVSDFDNKTLHSRSFSIQTDPDGHSPPSGSTDTYTKTLTFPYNNQTSHVTIYDENLQRADSHIVQNDPPSEEPEEPVTSSETPSRWYLGGGVGLLILGVLLYFVLRRR